MSNQPKNKPTFLESNAALLKLIKTLQRKHGHALPSKALSAKSDGPAMMNNEQKNIATKKSTPEPKSSQSQ